jgi:hypothetical protein
MYWHPPIFVPMEVRSTPPEGRYEAFHNGAALGIVTIVPYLAHARCQASHLSGPGVH